MTTATSEHSMSDETLGELLAEGPKKRLHQAIGSDDWVVVVFKDDAATSASVAAQGNADTTRLENQIACNAFRLLGECGVPVAYVRPAGVAAFVARKCRVLPYRVAVRREAYGAFLDRYPHVPEGHLLPQLAVELFLKAADPRWKGRASGSDEPLIVHGHGTQQVQLFDATRPPREPLLVSPAPEFFASEEERAALPEMRRLARHAFLVLERAFQLEGCALRDLTVRFGLDAGGTLVLTDIVDAGSWSVTETDNVAPDCPSRSATRGAVPVVPRQRQAELSARFRVPQQRIIVWRGSVSDNVEPFAKALGELASLMTVVTCSAHKEPVAAASTLLQMVQEVPDSVVIAYIGRSNGAGPTLSAVSTVPVITVPASVKEFPEDVWSSLRAPSRVPVMTVLEPSNAVLGALQILSLRNPRIYALLRSELETRMVNAVRLSV